VYVCIEFEAAVMIHTGFSQTGAYSGVGFAIPSNTIAREVPSLIKDGSYVHPWLGISGGKISPDVAKAAGLPANYKGVLVGSIEAGSPAEKAGLKGLTQDDNGATHIGDIITAIDGHPISQIDEKTRKGCLIVITMSCLSYMIHWVIGFPLTNTVTSAMLLSDLSLSVAL
jgi:S1-C subfamily serine protease